MYKINNFLLSSVVLIFSFLKIAHATPVLVDGREWMQVSDFTNVSWAQLDTFYFDSTTGQLKDPTNHHVIGGVDVTGWTWASVYDVRDMLLSSTYLGAGATCSTIFECYEADSAWAPKFMNDFTPTASLSYGDSVLGITRTVNGVFGGPFIYRVQDYFNTQTNDSISVFEATGSGFGSSGRYAYRDIWGAWLYREVSIPEPATLALLCFGLASLVFIRRHRRTAEPKVPKGSDASETAIHSLELALTERNTAMAASRW